MYVSPYLKADMSSHPVLDADGHNRQPVVIIAHSRPPFARVCCFETFS